MIALIDYGSGNLKSVAKAFLRLGADIRLVTRPEQVAGAQAVVLPGVGSFDDCLRTIRLREMEPAILEAIRSGKPFLGICVGYQALFQSSEEFGSTAPGLGVFAGKVKRFSEVPGVKVPQIGWNRIEIESPECPLYKGVLSGSYVYFVHSYYPVPEDSSIVATTTRHGDTYASSVWKDNVFAVQFHPEKSQKVGLKILKNFLSLIPE